MVPFFWRRPHSTVVGSQKPIWKLRRKSAVAKLFRRCIQAQWLENPCCWSSSTGVDHPDRGSSFCSKYEVPSRLHREPGSMLTSFEPFHSTTTVSVDFCFSQTLFALWTRFSLIYHLWLPDLRSQDSRFVPQWPPGRYSDHPRRLEQTGIGSDLLSSFMGSFNVNVPRVHDIAGRRESAHQRTTRTGWQSNWSISTSNLTYPYRTFVVQCKFEGSCQILNSVHRIGRCQAAKSCQKAWGIAHLAKCLADYSTWETSRRTYAHVTPSHTKYLKKRHSKENLRCTAVPRNYSNFGLATWAGGGSRK
jgi:hypothetical protein